MDQATKVLTLTEIPQTAEPGVDLAVASGAKQVTDWFASVDQTKFTIKSIHFQSMDVIKNAEGKIVKILFVKLRVEAEDKGTPPKPVPGILVLRGGAVAVLALFECEGETYLVITVQPRLATGQFDLEEVCAGMLDGSGNFGGVAAKELKEELDIVISEDDLTDLTALAGYDGGFYTSPGLLEETIRLFAFRKKVTRDELKAMEGKCTGALDENEQITLKIIRVDHLLTMGDGKSLAAYALYAKFGHLIKSI